MTISSTPVSRRCLLATIFGSKLESRSRGTEISTGPVSVITVLARWPLRELPPSRPARSCFPMPRRSSSSPSSAPSMTILVSLPSRPPSPVSFSPSARARAVSSRSSCSSAADSSAPAWPRSSVTSVIWCLLRLWSYTVEITVPIHHPGGRRQPRVGGTGDRVAALLGAEHALLFLRHPHVQHLLGHQPTVAGFCALQVPGGDVVLALPPGEAHQVQAAGGDEMADIRGDRRCHRRHQRRGREPVPPVPHEERRDPRAVLQPRLVHVQVHPVDRLDLEQHVIGQHLGSGSG